MNDEARLPGDQVKESESNIPGTTNAPPLGPPPFSLIPVKIVDAREPFPILAIYNLLAAPRPGDNISIAIENRLATYKVSFVNIQPFDKVSHLTVGCLPVDVSSSATDPDVTLKEQMDSYKKW
jgi:hypothetical protein